MTDVIMIARRLAEEHAEQLLPCPFCTAEVKGANLGGHLDKVHPTATARSSAVHGADRTMQIWTMLFAFVALGAASFALMGLQIEGRAWAVATLVVLTVVAIPVVLAYMGKFGAQIQVDSTGFTLHRLLRGRRLTYPIRIETGQMLERKESMMVKDGYGYRGPYHDTRAGSYMRFVGANGVGVVVGSKRSTHPLKYWAFDHSQGKKRRMWDIDLEPAELVRLQYMLSEHDVFRVPQ